MTMKSKYLALSMMGAMMSFAETNKPVFKQFEPPKEPRKIIPKGCKEFKFWHTDGQIFECVATSKKSADKKFKRFVNSLKNK